MKPILPLISALLLAPVVVLHAADFILVENGESLAPIILPAESTVFTKMAMQANWKAIEAIDRQFPEALNITRISEMGYIHPDADHKAIERRLQNKAVLKDRKDAKRLELNEK